MARTRGLCNAHYQKLWAYGDPLFTALKSSSLEERFWARVSIGGEDDCWLWNGHIISGKGYGQIRTGEKPRKWISVHRLALILARGPIREDSLACHTCEDRYPVGDITYRRCCNAAHLYEGTHATNAADVIRTGRGDAAHRVPHPAHRGEGNPSAKLATAQVLEIRERYAGGGETYFTLAEEFGVTFSSISYIVQRKTWKHI